MGRTRFGSYAALLLTALALVAAGCGGSDDGDSGGGSGGDFAQEFDQVCAEFQEKVTPLNEESQKTGRVTQAYVPVGERVLAITDETLTKFEAIDAPADSAAAFDEFVGLIRKQRDGVSDLLAALEATDVPKVQQLNTEIDLLQTDMEAAVADLKDTADVDCKA